MDVDKLKEAYKKLPKMMGKFNHMMMAPDTMVKLLEDKGMSKEEAIEVTKTFLVKDEEGNIFCEIINK